MLDGEPQWPLPEDRHGEGQVSGWLVAVVEGKKKKEKKKKTKRNS